MGKHGHRIATDEEVQATVREWEAEGFDPPPRLAGGRVRGGGAVSGFMAAGCVGQTAQR